MDNAAVELTEEMLEQLVQQSTALGWVDLLVWTPVMLLLVGVLTVVTIRLARSDREAGDLAAVMSGLVGLSILMAAIVLTAAGVRRLVAPLESALGGVFGGH